MPQADNYGYSGDFGDLSAQRISLIISQSNALYHTEFVYSKTFHFFKKRNLHMRCSAVEFISFTKEVAIDLLFFFSVIEDTVLIEITK